MWVSIKISHPPIPFTRARHFLRAGRIVRCIHGEHLKKQKVVESLLKQAWAPRGVIDAPVAVVYAFFRTPPFSLSKRKRAQAIAGEMLPATKPDEGNYTYFLDNRLEGICISNDSRIVAKQAFKFYGESDGIAVFIRPVSSREEIHADGFWPDLKLLIG